MHSGSKTLKDALNEAMRDWVTNVENTFYIIGTVAGPHPYPMLVRDFQRVIGDECRVQMPEMIGRQPDAVLACVGGGSNAMGIFYPYIPHAKTRLIGVEAAGEVAPLMLTGVVKLAPALPLDEYLPFLHLDRKFMHLGFHIYDVGFQSPNVEAAKPMVYMTTLILILVVVSLNWAAVRLRNRLRRRFAASAV